MSSYPNNGRCLALMLLGCASTEPPRPRTADGAAAVDAATAMDAAAVADRSASADVALVVEATPALFDAASAPEAAASCTPAPPGSAWAEWPVPDPTGTIKPRAHSYDTSAPDVVVDKVTGLMWERRVDAAEHTWGEAGKRCACLVLGGHDDWRLPSRIELVSIVDFTRQDPSIDVAAFPATPFEWFWSASLVTGDDSIAWYVAFFDGNTHKNSVDVEHRVRCVRGSPAGGSVPPPQRYTVRLDGTVLDARTGLTWQRAVDAANRTWSEAKAACARLPLAGGGWRLPDMKELQTILDESRAEPAIDPTAFPNTPRESFWSASPLAGMPADAWFVAFPSGITYSNAVDRMYRVRCVR